jgi:hypothetical protein
MFYGRARGGSTVIGRQTIETEFRNAGLFAFPVESHLVVSPGHRIALDDVYGPSVARFYVQVASCVLLAVALVLFVIGYQEARAFSGAPARFFLAAPLFLAAGALVFAWSRRVGSLSAEKARRWLALGAATGLNIDPDLLPAQAVRTVHEDLEADWAKLAPRADWRDRVGGSAEFARELVRRGRARSTEEVDLLLHALSAYALARKARSNDEREKASRQKLMERAWAALSGWAPASATGELVTRVIPPREHRIGSGRGFLAAP